MNQIASSLLIASLLGGSMLAVPATSSAYVSVGISVGIAPPPLLFYPQPLIPGPGYIWTPGYWAYGSYGYYWVPGTWVQPPEIGLLWTPGWWGWGDGDYRWHGGYWGSSVGFYGGVDYGYGYGGRGYGGGYWRGREFYYNRAVNNVNITNIRNVYVDKTVINNNYASANRVSYNGGRGGLSTRPTPRQTALANTHRVAATNAQVRQRSLAMNNPAQRFSVNHGKPAIAATARPGRFAGADAVRRDPASGTYRTAAMHAAPARMPAANAERNSMMHAPTAQPMRANADRGIVHAPSAQQRMARPQMDEQRTPHTQMDEQRMVRGPSDQQGIARPQMDQQRMPQPRQQRPANYPNAGRPMVGAPRSQPRQAAPREDPRQRRDDNGGH